MSKFNSFLSLTPSTSRETVPSTSSPFARILSVAQSFTPSILSSVWKSTTPANGPSNQESDLDFDKGADEYDSHYLQSSSNNLERPPSYINYPERSSTDIVYVNIDEEDEEDNIGERTTASKPKPVSGFSETNSRWKSSTSTDKKKPTYSSLDVSNSRQQQHSTGLRDNLVSRTFNEKTSKETLAKILNKRKEKTDGQDVTDSLQLPSRHYGGEIRNQSMPQFSTDQFDLNLVGFKKVRFLVGDVKRKRTLLTSDVADSGSIAKKRKTAYDSPIPPTPSSNSVHLFTPTLTLNDKFSANNSKLGNKPTSATKPIVKSTLLSSYGVISSETRRILREMERRNSPLTAARKMALNSESSLLNLSALNKTDEKLPPRVSLSTPVRAHVLPRLATLGSTPYSRPVAKETADKGVMADISVPRDQTDHVVPKASSKLKTVSSGDGQSKITNKFSAKSFDLENDDDELDYPEQATLHKIKLPTIPIDSIPKPGFLSSTSTGVAFSPPADSYQFSKPKIVARPSDMTPALSPPVITTTATAAPPVLFSVPFGGFGEDKSKNTSGFTPIAQQDSSKKNAGSTWLCNTCFIKNQPDQSKCIACQSERPNNAGFGKEKETWLCQTCFIKNSMTDVKCVACRTDKPGAVTPKQTFGDQKSIDNSFSKKDDTTPSVLATNKSNWLCQTCFISNPNDKTKCVACSTENPNSSKQTTPSISPAAKKSWSCTTCFVSNPPDKANCMACNSIKPGTTIKPISFGFREAESAKPASVPPAAIPKTTISFGLPATAAASPVVEKSEASVKPLETAAEPERKTVRFADPPVSLVKTMSSDSDSPLSAEPTINFGLTASAAPSVAPVEQVTTTTTTTSSSDVSVSVTLPLKKSSSEPTFTTPALAPFGFGTPATTSSGLSLFGAPAVTTAAAVVTTTTTTTTNTTAPPSGFGFSVPPSSTVTTASTIPVFGGISFQAPDLKKTATVPIGSTATAPPPFSFGTSTTTASAPSFSFGANSTSSLSTSSAPSFSFGASTTTPSGGGGLFGATRPTATTTASSAFAFSIPPPTTTTVSTFAGFQAPDMKKSATVPTISGSVAPPPFSFGTSTTTASAPSFSFGSNSTSSLSTSSAPSFSFGASNTTPSGGGGLFGAAAAAAPTTKATSSSGGFQFSVPASTMATGSTTPAFGTMNFQAPTGLFATSSSTATTSSGGGFAFPALSTSTTASVPSFSGGFNFQAPGAQTNVPTFSQSDGGSMGAQPSTGFQNPFSISAAQSQNKNASRRILNAKRKTPR